MSANPVPEGYNSVIPYLTIRGAADAIEYYKKVFGAKEVLRLVAPDGNIAHAEIRIGDSMIMVSEECGRNYFVSPEKMQGVSVGIHLYVGDVDSVFSKAVESGGTVIDEVKDQFYGDRMGTLRDPYGHIWFVATNVESLTQEEVRKRAEKIFSK